MNFKELQQLYSDNFSLGYINTGHGHSAIEERFILISLICYVYNKNKHKNPDLTYYSLIYKLANNLGLPDDFLKGLSIVCEDFAYQSNDFPTFGLEGKEILKRIVEILKSYCPF